MFQVSFQRWPLLPWPRNIPEPGAWSGQPGSRGQERDHVPWLDAIPLPLKQMYQAGHSAGSGAAELKGPLPPRLDDHPWMLREAGLYPYAAAHGQEGRRVLL